MSNSIQNYPPSFLTNVTNPNQVTAGTVSSASCANAEALDGFDPTAAQTQFLGSQAPLPAEAQLTGSGDSGAEVGQALLALLSGTGLTGSTGGSATGETHHKHGHGGHHRAGGSGDGSDASALELLQQLQGGDTGAGALGVGGGSALSLLTQLGGGSGALGTGDDGSGLLQQLGGGSDTVDGSGDGSDAALLQQLGVGGADDGLESLTGSGNANPLQSILQGGSGVLNSEPQPQFDLRKLQR